MDIQTEIKAVQKTIKVMGKMLPGIASHITPIGEIWQTESDDLHEHSLIDDMVGELGDAYEALNRAVSKHHEVAEFMTRRLQLLRAQATKDARTRKQLLNDIKKKVVAESSKRLEKKAKKEGTKAAKLAQTAPTSCDDPRVELYPMKQKNHYGVMFNDKYLGSVFKSRLKYDGETIIRFARTAKTRAKVRKGGKLVVEHHTPKHQARIAAWHINGDDTKRPFVDYQTAALAVIYGNVELVEHQENIQTFLERHPQVWAGMSKG